MMPALKPCGTPAPIDHPLACAAGSTIVRVLDWHDGPLCMLRRSATGEHVVFVWVDGDMTRTRWLAFAVPGDVAALLTHGDTGPTPEQLASITDGALVDLGSARGATRVCAVWSLPLADMPGDMLSDEMRAMDVPHRLAAWLAGPFHGEALPR